MRPTTPSLIASTAPSLAATASRNTERSRWCSGPGGRRDHRQLGISERERLHGIPSSVRVGA